MKLDYKRTFLVGLAFLSICAFWQMYDNIIPLILTDKFGLSKSISGFIMAADNVLALFLLPVFGRLSDRCNTRMGKRSPFILGGTLVAVSLMTILPILSNQYSKTPSVAIFVSFLVILGLLLITMSTYRSPAVALMPDVTPKPLRSKGNAIINLLGTIGGMIYLGLTIVLYSDDAIKNANTNFLPLFSCVAILMLVSVIILLLTINENKLRAETEEYERQHPEQDVTTEDVCHNKRLPFPVKRSLIFLLLSVSLWYIGYNAITTWFTKFAEEMWEMPFGKANLYLVIAIAGALVSYIPIGILSSKIGRKKTILLGVVTLAICFAAAGLYAAFVGAFQIYLAPLFLLVGFAWAAINVNSFPMVVEMCAGSDVGRFTGYYYAFSMAAQAFTAIVSGWLMDKGDSQILFPYAALFVAASFVTMLFVRHGDTPVIPKKSLLENFDVED